MAQSDMWFYSLASDAVSGNGIIKFSDGVWSTVYPLGGTGLGTNALCMATDTDDVLWVGTYEGLQEINADTGAVIATHIPDSSDKIIGSIAIDSNNVKWVTTTKNFYKFDGVWTRYGTPHTGIGSDFIQCIAIDEANNKWIGTLNHGLSAFDGTDFINYNTSNSGIVADSVHQLATDGNIIWTGSIGNGLSKLSDGEWATYTKANSPLLSDTFRKIKVDFNHTLWVGTTNAGVIRVSDWSQYLHINGTLADNIYDLEIDSAGNIWIGYSRGASKFNGSTWTNYTNLISSQLDSIISSISQYTPVPIVPPTWPPKIFKATIPTRNIIPSSPSVVKILQGTHKGVNIDAQGHGYLIDVWDDLPIDNQGIKWFGTDAGLQRFDGSSGTNYTTAPNGIQSNNVLSIAISGTDKWIGTDKGVQVLDVSGCFTNYNLKDYVTSDLKTTIDSFFKSGINSITIDALGNKWFGSNNGLMQLTPEIMKSVYILGASVISGTNAISGTLITTDNGLLSNIINSVAIETAGTAWIGTNEGLFKYDGYSLTSYTTASTSAIGGLFGDTIYSIAIDTSNNKWIGTDIGVYKFDGINWKSYLTTESVKAIGIDGQGFKWFAVAGGVYKFDGYSFVYYNTFSSRDTSLVGRSLRGAVSFSNYVSSLAIYKPSRIVWFGTNIGIQKYSGILPTTKFNTSNRLISNNIKAIAIEANPPAPKKVLATIPAERLPVFVTW